MEWKGHIISGEYDQQSDDFTLQQVKHFHTTSTLSQDQVNQLYTYLDRHKNETDGQILTLYDQLLIRLSQDEINQFMEDLEQIRELYH